MLEDDPVDAELIVGLLRKKTPEIEFTLASTQPEYELALRRIRPDLILADNSLPQFDASDALLYARLQAPDIPFIMVTGTVSEEYAVEMIKAGADDYILKDRLARLPAAIEAAINQRRAQTEKRRLEEEQVKLQIRQQKELTRAILRAAEQERTALGRELHDNINQILASVNLRLGYYLEEPEGNMAILEDCQRGLEAAIREMRHLSHQMVMPSFSEKSLRGELGLLAEHYIPALSITLDIQKVNENRVPPQVKEALYRIVQEQLSNIHKHAKANLVQVRMSTDTGWVVLMIIDDGVGFDPKVKRQGIGISNIYHRAESFDGKVEIVSRPGAGCTLVVKIPVGG